MKYRAVLMGTAYWVAASAFASELIMTAEDHAVDSDVVLESAVKEIKSIPKDTVQVLGDVATYVADEVQTAKEGLEQVFAGDVHAGTQADALHAVGMAWDEPNRIQFRSYTISEKLGDLLLSSVADREATSCDVSSFFKQVDFPEKTSIHYLPEFNSLFVHHTMENLLAIEKVLASYQREQRNLMGHQVEIETKFVEVTQSTLSELGFSWYFDSSDGGGLEILNDFSLDAGQDLLSSGLRTASQALGVGTDAGVLAVSKATGSFQWDLYISALEQSDDTDVLSAPRVVTLDGETATVQVGEQQFVPRSFVAPNSDSSPFIEHQDWEPELFGVTLEVTPEIRDEGLIDLELHPVVMEWAGTDAYQVTPDNISRTGSLTDTPSLYGEIPYVRIRELETYVTVADGSTVGMGGLIYDKLETYRDKVPVLGSIPLLGRLFRSEGEQSVKRNLMIFVTATQVDVDGRRAVDLAQGK